MKLDTYTNIGILILTLVGFIVGFINESYRLIAWSLSLIIASIIVIFLVFRDYISKIENNENQINDIKKSLNIVNRLFKLEGKVEVLEKRAT